LLIYEIQSLPERLGPPRLSKNSVHLWLADPKAHLGWVCELSALLSADERDRAARFHFEPDRQDFIFARGVLRALLGAYVKASPRELNFCYSEHGKPSLAEPHSETGLQFNLSHTCGAVLIAVCQVRAIGVDIERVRDDFSLKETAARFFSVAERRALMNLPEASRREAFFHCWTRKEAFLKARGDGLSFPLDLFDVSIAANDTAVGLITRPEPDEAQGWRILPVPVPAGYSAAVAVARQGSEAR
jgi:4'-phosphopantetheinyl transferase